MNSDDLRFFLAIRQARSIKGGARVLKVDQSTVTRRLAALEEALGAPLFDRSPEGLLETDVARAIAPLAERIELLTRELEEAANSASDSPKGPVRITTSPIFSEHFLIPRVPQLQRRFPDVPLDILADISRANMVRREADIAIRQHPAGKSPAEPSALAMKVGSLGFAAYASEAYLERHGRPEQPVTNLRGHRMIGTGQLAPGNFWNDQLEQPAEYAVFVHPLQSAEAAAAAGLGIAVLPCISADKNVELVRLTDVITTYDVWIVTSPQVRNNPRVRGIKDALVEMIRDADAEIRGTCDVARHRG